MTENRTVEAPKEQRGTLVNIGMAEDDQGRTVMRATVDFYDGNCPDITFATVWSRRPVTIIEATSALGE